MPFRLNEAYSQKNESKKNVLRRNNKGNRYTIRELVDDDYGVDLLCCVHCVAAAAADFVVVVASVFRSFVDAFGSEANTNSSSILSTLSSVTICTAI